MTSKMPVRIIADAQLGRPNPITVFSDRCRIHWRCAIAPPALLLTGLLPTALFAAPLSDNVNLSGNTFSWSDEGWYQVQDSTDYTSICGGGTSCTVEPGVYHVINHSTGIRLEFVTVPAEEPDPELEAVAVSGNTISWPDDGWYQVQDAQTYESLCQGDRSCVVPAGQYIVINHTTGERHTGINVSDADNPQPEPAAINRDNYLDMLTQTFEIYMGTAYDERLPTNDMLRLVAGEFTETRTPGEGAGYVTIDRLYTCHNGGTVNRTNYTGISPIISNLYTLDECQYQGEVISGIWSLTGYRTTTHANIELTDFSIEFPSQGELTADGGYRLFVGYYGYGGNPYDYSQRWRTEGLNYRLSYAEGTLVIENATTLGWYGYTSATYVEDEKFWNYHAHMNGEFDMKPTFQPESTIHVSTPTEFSEQRLETYSEGTPYITPPLPRFDTGELLLSADDGSTLLLKADNDDASSTRITIQNEDGEESFDLPWSSLDDAMAMRSFEMSWPRE